MLGRATALLRCGSTSARSGRTGPGCPSCSRCGPRGGSADLAGGAGRCIERLLESRTGGWSTWTSSPADAARATGVAERVCREYLGDLDYALSYRHLAGLTDFFRRLAQDGLVPDGSLSFITAA